MPKREIKKDLMGFVRREVNEKSADWGELRRIKNQILVKKGLPNIPQVVLQNHSNLSYMVLIRWSNELRLYLFDHEGIIQQGQSYFNSLQEVYLELKHKSKKIARYPEPKKIPTNAQREYQLDKRFQKVWTRLAKSLSVQKEYRKNRPIIKVIAQGHEGIFNSKAKNNYIYIPYDNPKQLATYTYFSLYFFLPASIRQNKELAEAIAFLLLISFDNFKNERLNNNHQVSEILLKLEKWSLLKTAKILDILYKVTEYYDKPWETSDFIVLVNIPKEKMLASISRTKIAELFCLLYNESQNIDFLVVSNFCGLPFGTICSIPSTINNNEFLRLFKWLKSWRFSKILQYLQDNKKSLSKGFLKALNEALIFQYSNTIGINLVNKDLEQFKFSNNSDLPVFLDNAVQIFPNGKEIDKKIPQIVINPKSSNIISLSDLKLEKKIPVRFQYRLMNSCTSILKPIFIGTIVI